jgi:hypothetical protein
MRLIAVAILLSSCALAQTGAPDVSCGPRDVAFTVSRDKSRHPTPPPDGEALLYVFGSNRFPGWGFSGTLAVDGAWVGAVSHNGDYFTTPITPGEHLLCARVTTRIGPFLTPAIPVTDWPQGRLNAKAGQAYYVDIHVGRKNSVGLRLLEPDKGKRLLASSTFSVSRAK